MALGAGIAAVRDAVRSLARARAFCFSTVIILAAVFAISATVLSLNGLFLYSALPYQGDGFLVDVRARVVTGEQQLPGNARGYADAWVDAASFAGRFAVASSSGGRLAMRDHDDYIGYASVGKGYFRVLNADAVLGHTLDELSPDMARARVAVISHALSRRLFGASPAVDKTIRLDGVDYQIVGVMPAEFRSPHTLAGNDEDVWIPLQPASSDAAAWGSFSTNLAVIGRVDARDGEKAVQVLLDAVTKRLSDTDGKGVLPAGTRVMPEVRPLRDAIVGEAYQTGMLMLAITACLAVLGFSIVGTLLVARMAARRPVWATHMMIGARMADMRRVAGIEVVIIVAAAFALAVPLNGYAVLVVRQLAAGTMPRVAELSIASSYLLLLACLAVMAGIAVAWGGLRTLASAPLAHELSGGSKGFATDVRFRARAVILGVQFFVIACVLYLGGLVLTDATRRLTTSVGFREEGSAYVQLFLPENQRDSTTKRDVMDRLTATLRADGLRGTTNVEMPTLSQALALFRTTSPDGSRIGDIAINGVGASYLGAMGMRVIAGRVFGEADYHDHADTLVVGESAARLLGGDGEALGRRLQVDGRGYTVIGVVNDVVNPARAGVSGSLQAYVPYEYTADVPTLAFFVFGDVVGRLDQIAADVRRTVPQAAIDANMPTTALRLDLVKEYRVKAIACAVLVLLAALMAVAGTQAVVHYLFLGKARDIATRMATGARLHHLVSELMALLLKPLAVALGIFTTLVTATVGVWGGVLGISGLVAALVTTVACAFVLGLLVVATGRATAKRLVRHGYTKLLHSLS